MSVWLDHIKATRKKCPELSYKEAMIEAKKTYNKSTKKAGPVVCKSSSKDSSETKKPSKRDRPSKKAKGKGKKSRKSKRRKTKKGKRAAKGRRTAKSKTRKHKVPKKFKCKLYPNAPDC